MNKKLYFVFIIAAVLLYVLMGRKTVASSAPVAQPGIAAGGINFITVDQQTQLPVFDNSANPAYVRGLAPTSGGLYQCGSGMTPAINATDGRVYCVIPADTIDFTPQAPNLSAQPYTGVPQGPVQAGGFFGQPSTQPYTGAVQGPTQSGGILGQPNTDASSSSDISPVFDSGGVDSSSVFFS